MLDNTDISRISKVLRDSANELEKKAMRPIVGPILYEALIEEARERLKLAHRLEQQRTQ